VFSLGDVYGRADLITYPSTVEGFGNAFLEAVYYRKPIVVNSYSIYTIDIRPKGFRVVEFDGYISNATVSEARQVIQNKSYAEEMVELNYQLASQYFSFSVLRRRLKILLSECLGE
jgi:glycosyltransferase involved in cell wall biosynthesis